MRNNIEPGEGEHWIDGGRDAFECLTIKKKGEEREMMNMINLLPLHIPCIRIDIRCVHIGCMYRGDEMNR